MTDASACPACEALKKVGSSLLSYLSPNDTPLCGFHASELARRNGELEAALRKALSRSVLFHGSDLNRHVCNPGHPCLFLTEIKEAESLLRAGGEGGKE